MNDKVQKIREEVVRMHNLLPIIDGDNISVNYADRICTTLEQYIDSLQEEPVSEDLEEADLEESASRYAKEEYSHKNPATLPDRCRGCYAPLMYAFKAGAKWQKEKDSILPKVWNRENLDEFSYQTAYDLSNDWIKETPTWHDVEMACKLGAKWKEEQLEKEKGRNNYGNN